MSIGFIFPDGENAENPGLAHGFLWCCGGIWVVKDGQEDVSFCGKSVNSKDATLVLTGAASVSRGVVFLSLEGPTRRGGG